MEWIYVALIALAVDVLLLFGVSVAALRLVRAQARQLGLTALLGKPAGYVKPDTAAVPSSSGRVFYTVRSSPVGDGPDAA